ncbi:hypothetical protein DICSQDRAFT_71908, partial [Dichomitus squalens LYAD-421 SS1]
MDQPEVEIANPIQREPSPEAPPRAKGVEEEEPEFGAHDVTGVLPTPTLEDLKQAIAFIAGLENALLEASGLDPKAIERMRNPERDLPDLTVPENRALRLALKQFIATGHSEKIYRDCRANIMEYNEGLTLPSYEAMQKLVQELSGVVPIVTDMCPDTCVAYTGPFADLDRCPAKDCGIPRYETREGKRVACRTFQTHPLGPQVQAL